MKRLKKFLNKKTVTQIAGIVIGIAAIYLSLRHVNSDSLKQALSSMNRWWILPIVIGNFFVIALKSVRWQFMISPVKRVGFILMFRVLMIGFMANNILPARMGEAVKIHLLGKDAFVSRITTTGTAIADKIVECISFLIMAAILMVITDVPKWMHSGLTITLLITFLLYISTAIYSKRRIENRFLKKLQTGIRSLFNLKLTSLALATSVVSWLLQGILIYMTQLAFGVDIPVWGILLVLIAVNLAIALPSAPSHLGTFEFACILAYTYLGLDKSTALLIGVTYHLSQIIPVTLAGGLMTLSTFSGRGRALQPEGPDTACP